MKKYLVQTVEKPILNAQLYVARLPDYSHLMIVYTLYSLANITSATLTILRNTMLANDGY
jgi:hypothetical protein